MRRYRLSEQNTSCNKLFGKRVLFFCAVFYLLGSLIAAEFNASVPMCMIFGALFLLLYILFRKKPFSLAAILAAVFFIGLGVTAAQLLSIDADISRVERSIVEGRVIEISTTESGKSKYKLTDVTAGGEELRHCAYVYADTDEFDLGDVIRAYGENRQPARKSHAYDFDARLYNASENVSVLMYPYFIEKRDEQPTVIQKIRTGAAEKIDRLFGEKAGTAKAMLIGMDADIDRATMRAYRDAGISHILCISGLHVSVIAAAVSMLLRKLRAGKLAAYIATVVFLLGYMLIAGGSDSIVRAVILNIVLLSAGMFRRRGDNLTALSVGFFLCVMKNPASILGKGFQLSFGCVFTLICVAEAFGNKKLFSAIGAAVCGLAATTAILWNVSLKISPLTVLFNLAAVPLAGVVLIVLIVSLILFLITGSAFPWIGVVGKFLLGILDRIAAASEVIRWDIPVHAVHPIAILCIFFAIFFLSRYLIAPRGIKLGCAAAMLLVFAVIYAFPQNQPMLRIDFLAGEYADTAVVRDDEGNCVLIDAGNPYGAEYLAAYGMEAQWIFLSSEAQRSIGGAEQYPDAEFILPSALKNGDRFQMNDRVTVTALKGEGDTHADYLISCGGENVLLYMGASARETEYPTAKVLKLSSDGKKNIAFAGKSGAEYVILRENTEEIAAISTQKAGVVTVRYDGEVTVESEYDGRTIPERTESQ